MYQVENLNGSLKRLISRILSFRRNRGWVAVLQTAVQIHNSTPSSGLLGLSPKKALLPSNIALLQSYYIRKRAEKAERYLHKKSSIYAVGDDVKIVVRDLFRQRGDKERLSQKTYKITQVLNSSVPICYRIQGHTKTFYKQELVPSLDSEQLSKSVTSNKILAILSQKRFPTKFLRSGKATSFENRFLVQDNRKAESHYLTRDQVLEFDNGSTKLESFELAKLNV